MTLAGLAHPGRSDREILEQRLAPVVDPGSTDTLEDVGWLFAERGDRMLRAASGHRLGLEFVDVTMLSAANLGALLPGDRPVHVLRVRLEFDPIPATDVALLVDGSAFDTLDAAELGAGAGPATNRPPATMAEPVAARAAVVLHAFLTDDATFEIVRRCCAKVGLDVVRHAGATAPNPSALHGDIVLIDAPPGFDRRFEWCHRLKEGRPDLTVALLVPVPSRARVVRGFEARADAVIGWPIDPLDFALRLRKLGAPGSGSGG